MNAPLGYLVRITTASGQDLHWHKNGVLHRLSPQLGPTWIAHFNKDLWQVSEQGAFVPKGSDPGAQAIAAVALEAVVDD